MTNHENIVLALQALRPKAQWNLRGDSIEWLDTLQTRPSDIEIAVKIQEITSAPSLQAQWAALALVSDKISFIAKNLGLQP